MQIKDKNTYYWIGVGEYLILLTTELLICTYLIDYHNRLIKILHIIMHKNEKFVKLTKYSSKGEYVSKI